MSLSDQSKRFACTLLSSPRFFYKNFLIIFKNLHVINCFTWQPHLWELWITLEFVPYWLIITSKISIWASQSLHSMSIRLNWMLQQIRKTNLKKLVWIFKVMYTRRDSNTFRLYSINFLIWYMTISSWWVVASIPWDIWSNMVSPFHVKTPDPLWLYMFPGLIVDPCSPLKLTKGLIILTGIICGIFVCPLPSKLNPYWLRYFHNWLEFLCFLWWFALP